MCTIQRLITFSGDEAKPSSIGLISGSNSFQFHSSARQVSQPSDRAIIPDTMFIEQKLQTQDEIMKLCYSFKLGFLFEI